MARETKTTIIRQIHEKHYTFNGKSYKPKDYFKSWCEDNNTTLAISRLNIKDLIRYRDFMSKDNDSEYHIRYEPLLYRIAGLIIYNRRPSSIY